MSPADQARAEFATDLTELECSDIRRFYALEEVQDGQQ